eukprot:gene23723-13346_t
MSIYVCCAKDFSFRAFSNPPSQISTDEIRLPKSSVLKISAAAGFVYSMLGMLVVGGSALTFEGPRMLTTAAVVSLHMVTAFGATCPSKFNRINRGIMNEPTTIGSSQQPDAGSCCGYCTADPKYDQDEVLGSRLAMPKAQKLLTEQGASASNWFIFTPVCCPSRAEYLT